ncbi:hypothetical protein Pla52o_03880 [Novipirellula galeiformis]|uniref:Uncharacterized protein n=1 Tax=Novipirellula galeiformis TaxID=2528004 RepID=A0A5C6CRQ0_9BACT|nr:hypothetical protein Pla52o_03880 [Novipirellula galeiformis]
MHAVKITTRSVSEGLNQAETIRVESKNKRWAQPCHRFDTESYNQLHLRKKRPQSLTPIPFLSKRSFV